MLEKRGWLRKKEGKEKKRKGYLKPKSANLIPLGLTIMLSGCD